MPFIKRLKIYGFKSFPYKTDIEFRDGITGIVGPNGCGKSNIIDSLMWVFGEKSSKSLRGDVSADVIFDGTEEHKPLGFAEVEVIVDNENSLLPVDFREVSIKRRIYRSGESEFFINKQKCRLKDIYDLFADTGIGKSSYSIMSQNKIDMIISTKPEDRREIFEEAAGISRYKLRLKETMSKIEQTENNLEQVNLFLKEIKQERDRLKEQAESAKIYRKYQEELKKLEIVYYGYRYKTGIAGIKNIENKINILKEKKINLSTKQAKLEVQLEVLNKKITDYTTNKYEKVNEQSKFEQIIKGNEDKIKIYTEQLKHNESLIKEREKRTNILVKNNENLEAVYKEKELNIKNQDKEIEDLEKQKIFLEGEIEKIINRIELNLKNKKELENESEELIKMRRVKNDELQVIKDEFVKEIDKKKHEVEGVEGSQFAIKNEVMNMIDKIETDVKRLIEITNSKGSLNETEIKNIIDSIENLRVRVKEIVVHQDEFKNMIFDKNGIYARKEKLDKEISDISTELITKHSLINGIVTENQSLSKDEKELNSKLNDINARLDRNKYKSENIRTEMKKIKEDILRNSREISDIKKEVENFLKLKEENSKSIEHLQKEILRLNDTTDNFNKLITKINEEINSISEKKKKIKDEVVKISEDINMLDTKISDMKENYGKTSGSLQDYKETLYNEYNVKVEDIIKDIKDNINLQDIRKESEKIKTELKNLGSVNLLAEEEYEDASNRYNFNLQQKEDLLKAKNDLTNIIAETNRESTRLFLETLDNINENFHYVFRRLFGGGKANLTLDDPNNPLESGIIINVQPPGKKLKSINWLSGGEHSLSAIGLMFAIFLVKPSPFCAMDEIDAALDAENNQRFTKMMKEFAKNTQFLLISHNPNTISNVDYLYGVSMEEKGVTKIVSLDLKRTKIEEYIEQK